MIGIIAQGFHGYAKDNIKRVLRSVTRIEEILQFRAVIDPAAFADDGPGVGSQRVQFGIGQRLPIAQCLDDVRRDFGNVSGQERVCRDTVFATILRADGNEDHLLLLGRERAFFEQCRS